MRCARLAVCALFLASSNAWALLDSCDVTATTVPFGIYNPANTSPLEATGNIRVTCVVLLVGLNVSWTLFLDDGTGTTYFPRRMTSGADTLNYNIYTTSSYGTIWGNGVSGTGTVSDSNFLVVGSTQKDYTTHGRIPALQDVRPGSYGDSVVVTILF